MSKILKDRQCLIKAVADEPGEVGNARREIITILRNRKTLTHNIEGDAMTLAEHLIVIDDHQGSDGYFVVDPELRMSIVDVLHKLRGTKDAVQQTVLDQLSGHLSDLMHRENELQRVENTKGLGWTSAEESRAMARRPAPGNSR